MLRLRDRRWNWPAQVAMLALLPPPVIQPASPAGGSGLPGPPIALVGVLYDGTTPARSLALIHCDGVHPAGRSALVGLHQTACDRVTIDEIHQDRVVVHALGEETATTIALAASSSGGLPPSTSATARREPPPVMPPSRPTPEVLSVTVPRQLLEDVMKDLPSFLTSAQVTPRYADSGPTDSGRRAGAAEKIAALDLSFVVPGGPVDRLGLRNGDIIRGIDGVSWDSPDIGLGLLRQLQERQAMTIRIERDGIPRTLHVTVR